MQFIFFYGVLDFFSTSKTNIWEDGIRWTRHSIAERRNMTANKYMKLPYGDTDPKPFRAGIVCSDWQYLSGVSAIGYMHTYMHACTHTQTHIYHCLPVIFTRNSGIWKWQLRQAKICSTTSLPLSHGLSLSSGQWTKKGFHQGKNQSKWQLQINFCETNWRIHICWLIITKRNHLNRNSKREKQKG